jgi:hypothetical protein
MSFFIVELQQTIRQMKKIEAYQADTEGYNRRKRARCCFVSGLRGPRLAAVSHIFN